MFSTSVKALLQIKIKIISAKRIGTGRGTWIGRRRWGSLYRKTIKPIVVKKIAKKSMKMNLKFAENFRLTNPIDHSTTND